MSDGRHVKGHLERLRKAMIRRGLAGFWFIEFQQRGAAHFHVFCCGTLSQEARDSLRATWAKIVGSKCPHHLRRGMDYQVLRKAEAAAGYAAKYSSKNEQKTVPDCYKGIGRFWGFFGDFPAKTAVTLSMRDVYALVRVARAAAKAQARARGPAIRYFLERSYTGLGNPVGYSVVARQSHSLGC
jgi:hypothetical protein